MAKSFEDFDSDVRQFYQDAEEAFDACPHMDSIQFQLHPQAEVVRITRDEVKRMRLHHQFLSLQ